MPILLGAGDPRIADSRDRRDLSTKQALPLVSAVGLLAIQTAAPQRDRAVLGQVGASFKAAEAPGVRLRFMTANQAGLRRRLVTRRLPWSGWRLELNLAEAAELSAWPLPDAESAPARSMAAPGTWAEGVIVGRGHHRHGRPVDVAFPIAARLMHSHILGPTGVGKSTLLAQLAIQDIGGGRGVVVLDPKRDLITDIAERVPADRVDDVVIFDPAVAGQGLRLNPLAWGNPQSATDFVVALMRGLFARSWGPRTEDVLRTSVLSLALKDGHTLVDLPRLLTDENFRRHVLAAVPPHPLLAEYWNWFESLSAAHRAEITAPLLSRLRSLLLAGPLHRILSDPNPRFDLDIVFRKRKTVLVPLSADHLSADGAGLLGALVMARLWQLTEQRSSLPATMRHPVMLYLDEFHQYLHLPTSMAETLAQARGLGVGLTLAHQHLGQLTPEVRAAVLANARNRVVFQLPAKDAQAMAADMAPLIGADLQALRPFQAYSRSVERSTVNQPISIATETLQPGDRRTHARIATASIQRWGQINQPQPASPTASTQRRIGGTGPSHGGERGVA